MQLALSLIFGTWFCVMIYLGLTDFFGSARKIIGLSAIQQAIAFPIAIFLIAYFIVPALASFVRNADLTFLVALQGVRILALSHMVLWGYGLMAGGFAIPVAVGNLVVCVLALTMVSAVSQKVGRWRVRIYILTIVGISEFLMTIGLAVSGRFTAPLSIDPPIALAEYVSFATAPLSLFPTFAIPALLIMHLVTIIALRNESHPLNDAT